jgi:hypothetical protein
VTFVPVSGCGLINIEEVVPFAFAKFPVALMIVCAIKDKSFNEDREMSKANRRKVGNHRAFLRLLRATCCS